MLYLARSQHGPNGGSFADVHFEHVHGPITTNFIQVLYNDKLVAFPGDSEKVPKTNQTTHAHAHTYMHTHVQYSIVKIIPFLFAACSTK